MNQSINPCDNFYQYACGSYIKNAIFPADKTSISFFSKLVSNVRDKLKDSIENQVTEKDPETFKKLKGYYNACLNETQIERESRNEFLNTIERMGGWPLVEGYWWDDSTFDWIDTMINFQKEGYSAKYFINYGLISDMKNNSKHIIYIDQPSLAIPRKFLIQGLNDSIVQSYYQFMLQFAKIIGIRPCRAKHDLKKSLEFEIALAKITAPDHKLSNVQEVYNPLTVEQLRSRYPDIPFSEFLAQLLAPSDNVLRDDDIVMVASPSYFDNLTALLVKTPKRVQANYAYWQIALASINQLDSEIQKASQDFNVKLNGQRAQNARWEKCVKELDSTLNLATGALYVRRYFDKETKDGALEMVENLRAAFRSMLFKVKWMDNETKTAAIDKLDNVIPLVAYPDELLNDTLLDGYYESLQIDSDSYFKTVRKTQIFIDSHVFDHLRKPASRSDWTGWWGQATVVNAFYDALANTINIPAGILQGSFFNKDLPKYVNYAHLGCTAGHEMTHGFDNTGRLFDKFGNRVDWWSLETKNEFLKRANCMVKQYDNYIVEEVGLHVNGSTTEPENIADNGGIKEAYLAYTTWLKKNGNEAPLPGLEKFTSNQMFWLSNANQWCIKYRPEYIKNSVLLDSHAPNEYRSIGMLSNMYEFAQDFNCPEESKMNPKHKCAVW